jgi:hypothetical protein
VSGQSLSLFLVLEAMDTNPVKLLTVNSAFHHKVSSVLNRSAEYASKVSYKFFNTYQSIINVCSLEIEPNETRCPAEF